MSWWCSHRWIIIVLVYRYNSLWVDMSQHSNTLSWKLKKSSPLKLGGTMNCYFVGMMYKEILFKISIFRVNHTTNMDAIGGPSIDASIPSFSSFGQVVSEEKIQMWKVHRCQMMTKAHLAFWSDELKMMIWWQVLKFSGKQQLNTIVGMMNIFKFDILDIRSKILRSLLNPYQSTDLKEFDL
jgi:hypothetical protein